PPRPPPFPYTTLFRSRPPEADRHGDPLPAGALLRLGTVRWRQGGRVMAVAISPDGKTVATGGVDHVIHLREAATGKSLRVLRGRSEEHTSELQSPYDL